RAVPAVLSEPERDVPTARTAVRLEPCARTELDRASGVRAVAADAEAQMLSLPDRAELAELAAGREQRDLGVAEPERREPLQLLAEIERQPRPARQDRVDRDVRPQLFVRELALRVCRPLLDERVERLRLERQPRRRLVSAPALEHARRVSEARVQVERRDRTARALPLVLLRREHDDRTVEALDEPGCDDADDTLVPVAVERVRTPLLLLGRPRVDLRDSLAEDPALDRLPLAVQLLERAGEAFRLV